MSPASRTARLTKYEFRPSKVGWSSVSMAVSSADAKSCSVSRMSRCTVPMAAATAPATPPSSYSASSKLNVKVCTGASLACFASAATALESMPPDRKTPTGTSEMRCRATLSRTTARNSSRSAGGCPSGRGIDQYRVRSGACVRSHVQRSPGPTGSMPSTAVTGPATKPFQRIEATARRSSRGERTRPEARMARTSDAKTSDHSPCGSGLRYT